MIKYNGQEAFSYYNGQECNVYFGTAYNPLYEDILDFAITLGYDLPPLLVRQAQNRRLNDMINNGAYELNDTIYMLSEAQQYFNFSRLDWKRIGTLADAYGGFNNTVNGMKPNAINGYFDTNFNPVTDGVNYTQNNASRYAIIYERGVGGSGRIDGNASTYNRMALDNTVAHRINSSGVLNTPAFTNVVGMKYIGRLDDINVRLQDKSGEYFASQPANSLQNLKQLLGKNGEEYTNPGYSFYAMGGYFIEAIVTAERMSHNTYLSTIGKNPIA